TARASFHNWPWPRPISAGQFAHQDFVRLRAGGPKGGQPNKYRSSMDVRSAQAELGSEKEEQLENRAADGSAYGKLSNHPPSEIRTARPSDKGCLPMRITGSEPVTPSSISALEPSLNPSF